jgi:hypothetical protein
MMKDFKPILKPHYQETQEKENETLAILAGTIGGIFVFLCGVGLFNVAVMIVGFFA